MDVRIGVTQAPREIALEIPDDERDQVKAAIDAALSGAKDTLWLQDKRGKLTAIPAAKIAYIEILGEDAAKKVGFGR